MDNDGVTLHYSVTASAGGNASPSLILLHGWSASSRSFDNSIDLLLKKR